MHKTTWALTHKWADAVLFGNFETEVVVGKKDVGKVEKKGKAKGGQHRVIYTERHAAYDAKNRLNLPGEIDMGESAAEGWTALSTAIKEARKAQESTATEGVANAQ